MAKAIHTMIRVFDLDRSMAFYADAFGLKLAERFEFDDFTLAYLRNGENDFEVELTYNHDPGEAYTHGSGYGHLAVVVDDIEAEHARFAENGFGPGDVVDMKHAGTVLARFFFVEDPDGYKIEVIQRSGRYQ